MTQYVAIINVPGYLPMDDEPPVFSTPAEAWSYLADERRESEDQEAMAQADESEEPYSVTVQVLDAYASAGHGPDTVYGDTPGYTGGHDLGLAYSVDIYEPPADEYSESLAKEDRRNAGLQ